MEGNLYFIVNRGCDAETRGLARVNDEDFPKFKALIENLNKNSYYSCMPTISVYKVDINDLKEITYNPDTEIWEDDYVEKSDIFYLGDKTYTFADRYLSEINLKCVI